MASSQTTTYHCDKCGKKLPKDSRLQLVTKLQESDSSYWSRLVLKIMFMSGVHNNSTTEDADLCQSCTITLLKDALRRACADERASAGTEEIEVQGWSK